LAQTFSGMLYTTTVAQSVDQLPHSLQ